MVRYLLSACVGVLFVGAFTAAPAIEELPMPQEDSEFTCPYLIQQMKARQTCQPTVSEVGRDVMDNFKRLKAAENLVEQAKELAHDGRLQEAMECCARAEELCPGSPCAERAAETKIELAQVSEAGIEPMVCGIMKSCHLLMNQGMYHQAAELALQAYALDPQRVVADPLIYKMHLLAVSPVHQSDKASEESEPRTCPYCNHAGKPIGEIVRATKQSNADNSVPQEPEPAIDYDFEVSSTLERGLSVSAECTVGDCVYHVRFRCGCLKLWKTSDTSKSKP